MSHTDLNTKATEQYKDGGLSVWGRKGCVIVAVSSAHDVENQVGLGGLETRMKAEVPAPVEQEFPRPVRGQESIRGFEGIGVGPGSGRRRCPRGWAAPGKPPPCRRGLRQPVGAWAAEVVAGRVPAR